MFTVDKFPKKMLQIEKLIIKTDVLSRKSTKWNYKQQQQNHKYRNMKNDRDILMHLKSICQTAKQNTQSHAQIIHSIN